MERSVVSALVIERDVMTVQSDVYHKKVKLLPKLEANNTIK